LHVNEKIGRKAGIPRPGPPREAWKDPGITPAGLWKLKTEGKGFLSPVTLEKAR